ncbi:MAG: hypothetical protein HQM10_23400 [Candidatus Riflebacteria bacterium]|nr:hypothetical protein [Candidatus Riflebacteria bacterium]
MRMDRRLFFSVIFLLMSLFILHAKVESTPFEDTVVIPAGIPLHQNAVEKTEKDIERAFGIKISEGLAGEDASRWAPDDLAFLYGLIDSLPPYFTRMPDSIKLSKETDYSSQMMTSVTMFVGFVTNMDLTVKTDTLQRNKETLRYIYIHEFAHCLWFDHKNIQSLWERAFWPGGKAEPPSITDYGNSNIMEDFAESIAVYVASPTELLKKNHERYDFIERHVVSLR